MIACTVAQEKGVRANGIKMPISHKVQGGMG